ncbi:cysteine desulfurase [Pseudomonas sp. REST10]|nr:cysteine desulfurase family protein [Pseudomonas sp. REST10]WFC63605.1 cysteine desulfurase [Pseudomonas sp. REST10]
MRVDGKIYLDYQASTPLDAACLEAMLPFFTHDFGNPHSTDHALGWSAAAAIDLARLSVAKLIGASPEEVFFTSGATESNNHIIQTVARATGRSKILVSAVEHKSVLAAANAAAKFWGMEVHFIPVDSSGLVNLECYKAMLDQDVALVSIMAVNNEIGTIQPIPDLVKAAHAVGALFLCDAAQAPTGIDIDVYSWDLDFLSLSAHKLYGPKGIGALYVRSDLLVDLEPLIYGGGQQGGVRSGTLSTPLCVGFGAAADLICEDSFLDRSALNLRKSHFLEVIKSNSVSYVLNGVQGEYCHPGNISVRFLGVDASSLLLRLQSYICASTGSACNSGFINQSHVLRAIGLSEDESSNTVRFSFGRFTDSSQVEEAAYLICNAIKKV